MQEKKCKKTFPVKGKQHYVTAEVGHHVYWLFLFNI